MKSDYKGKFYIVVAFLLFIIYSVSALLTVYSVLFVCLFIKIYFRERTGEGQRERERESQAESTLCVEPGVGLDLTTLRS